MSKQMTTPNLSTTPNALPLPVASTAAANSGGGGGTNALVHIRSGSAGAYTLYVSNLNRLVGTFALVWVLSLAPASWSRVWSQEAADEVDNQIGEAVEEVDQTVVPVADERDVEEVIVTGSRIRRDAFSSSSPIEVITSERTQLAGLLDTSDILQGSTIASGQQIDDSFSGFVTDGGPGANSVSLRGLGAERTLILVNGKRWGPSGVRGSITSVDVTAIPSSIISRIEILKDGASSVYGADAVAGVINIITKERQDAFQLNVGGAAPLDGGAENFSIDGIWGKVGDDWSLNVAVDYTRQSDFRRAERSDLACDTQPRITDQDGDGNIDNRDPATGELLCFGPIFGLVSSPFGFVRYDPSLVPGSGPDNPNYDDMVNGDFGIPLFTRVDEGPLDNQGNFYRDTTSFAVAQVVPESERFSVTSFGEKEVNLFGRDASVFYEFYYNQRDTEANGGFQQLFPTVPATNPYNPFGTNGPLAAFGGSSAIPVLISGNVLDPVNYVDVERTNTFVGIKGDLTETWAYEAVLGYSDSSGTYEAQRILEDRLNASLDAVVDASGNVVCRDLAGFPGCVAANWFSEDALLNGNFSQEYLNYIRKRTRGKTDYEQVQLSAYVDGPLFEMGGGSAQAVFGIEVRRNEINDTPDIEDQRDNIFNATTSGITAGDDTVNEAFVEFEFPFAKGASWAEELTLNAAARYTDYESFGDDTTTRLQLNWQINETFRLRATAGESFRAPALFEQFLERQTGFADGFLDPCLNFGNERVPGDVVYDNCVAQGVPLDLGVNGVPAIRAVSGGNPNLDAETSDSITYGVVLTPESLDFSLAVNYFDIELENSIASPSVGFVLNDCFTSVGFSSPFCSRVAPRDANGALTDIDASLLNVGLDRSRGFDFDFNYEREFSTFDLTVDATVTNLREQFFELLGDEFDITGRWGFPRWSGDLDFIADWRDWRFLWNLNYIGGTREDPVFDPGTDNIDRISETDDVFYHTLSARYTSPENWQIIATLRNVLDQKAPIVSDGVDSDSATRVFNTLPGTGYDLLGPTFVLQFSMEF